MKEFEERVKKIEEIVKSCDPPVGILNLHREQEIKDKALKERELFGKKLTKK